MRGPKKIPHLTQRERSGGSPIPAAGAAVPQRLLVLAVAPTQTQGGKAPRAPTPSAEGWVSKGPFRKENHRAKLSSHHFLAVASQTRAQLPV